MSKINLIYILICLLFSACAEDDNLVANSCGVTNPVEQLPWLKASIQDLEKNRNDPTYKYFYISQGVYENQVVFILGNCCPFCNTITPVRNCEGELLFYKSSENLDKILSEQALWLPVGNDCNFI